MGGGGLPNECESDCELYLVSLFTGYFETFLLMLTQYTSVKRSISVLTHLYLTIFHRFILNNLVLKFSKILLLISVLNHPGYSRVDKGNLSWSMLCCFESPDIKCFPLSGVCTPISVYKQKATKAIMENCHNFCLFFRRNLHQGCQGIS